MWTLSLTISSLKRPSAPAFRRTVDFFDDESFLEPADGLLAETLKSGIVDGTIDLSDSEYGEELDSEIECKLSFFVLSSWLTHMSCL